MILKCMILKRIELMTEATVLSVLVTAAAAAAANAV